MLRRVLLTFAMVVGLFQAWDALRAGDRQEFLILVPLLAVGGFLLWRNFRDEGVGRAAGHQAAIAWPLGAVAEGPGTYARIRSQAGTWDVALDRPPEQGDLTDTASWSAWVWLGEDGLPVKVRRTSGGGFRHWAVLRAAPAAED